MYITNQYKSFQIDSSEHSVQYWNDLIIKINEFVRAGIPTKESYNDLHTYISMKLKESSDIYNEELIWDMVLGSLINETVFCIIDNDLRTFSVFESYSGYVRYNKTYSVLASSEEEAIRMYKDIGTVTDEFDLIRDDSSFNDVNAYEVQK